jgi:hypothetical protein
VHADPVWRQHAERVCVDLGSYIHQLNTSYPLYTALARALAEQGGASGNEHAGHAGLGWSEEALLTGRSLLRDFQRCTQGVVGVTMKAVHLHLLLPLMCAARCSHVAVDRLLNGLHA